MPERTPIIAANWKMNNTIAESLAHVDAMLPRLQTLSAVDRVVCPPFTSLSAVSERLRASGIHVGAQNLYPEPKGAFTGEISPPMVRELASYVIVGHSERREHFGDDDELVNRKVKAALAHELVPILCVGESLAQKERGETEAVVSRQVHAALHGVDQLNQLVVAYEPVWAIGTGHAATAEGANATVGVIRRCVADIAGAAVADRLRIQYGGSVTPDNFAAFIQQPEIDGALCGGASLRADHFVEIVRVAADFVR